MLILGETGTGKELIARIIHDRSQRENRALAKLNCGAIFAGLVENLQELVREGKFRADLFYRLNVVPLRVPGLRERASDIPLLAKFFVQKFAKKFGKQIKSINDEAMRWLTNYSWPGNIRELQNVIERAVILSPGKTLILAEELHAVEKEFTPPLRAESRS